MHGYRIADLRDRPRYILHTYSERIEALGSQAGAWVAPVLPLLVGETEWALPFAIVLSYTFKLGRRAPLVLADLGWAGLYPPHIL